MEKWSWGIIIMCLFSSTNGKVSGGSRGSGGGGGPLPWPKKMVTLIFTLKREEDGPLPLAKKGEGWGCWVKRKIELHTHTNKKIGLTTKSTIIHFKIVKVISSVVLRFHLHSTAFIFISFRCYVCLETQVLCIKFLEWLPPKWRHNVHVHRRALPLSNCTTKGLYKFQYTEFVFQFSIFFCYPFMWRLPFYNCFVIGVH